MESTIPATEVRHLLLEALEQRTNRDPSGTFAKIPALSTSYSDGFRSVSNFELQNSVNQVAWWLETQLGKSEDFETLAYLGPGDLRYSIVLLAGIKTGHNVGSASHIGVRLVEAAHLFPRSSSRH